MSVVLGSGPGHKSPGRGLKGPMVPSHQPLGKVVGHYSPDAHRLFLSRASQGVGVKVLVQNMSGFVSP